jgi:hypothetical protein
MHSIVLVDDLDISLSDVFGDPVMTTSGQPLALLRNCLRWVQAHMCTVNLIAFI